MRLKYEPASVTTTPRLYQKALHPLSRKAGQAHRDLIHMDKKAFCYERDTPVKGEAFRYQRSTPVKPSRCGKKGVMGRAGKTQKVLPPS